MATHGARLSGRKNKPDLVSLLYFFWARNERIAAWRELLFFAATLGAVSAGKNVA
jgi:hypothetical protein